MMCIVIDCAVRRRGKSLSMRGDYEAAEADLTAAAQLLDAATAKEAEAALAANSARRKAAEVKQRSEFKNFFAR